MILPSLKKDRQIEELTKMLSVTLDQTEELSKQIEKLEEEKRLQGDYMSLRDKELQQHNTQSPLKSRRSVSMGGSPEAVKVRRAFGPPPNVTGNFYKAVNKDALAFWDEQRKRQLGEEADTYHFGESFHVPEHAKNLLELCSLL